jgi:hypothetical protein
MRISKSTKTSVKASKSFETIGLEPRQRTALDGKTYWVVFDTEEQKYSTLTQFGKYDSKKDCQYAIDKYKSQLSKTLGRDFADTDDVDACGDIKCSTSTDKALQHIRAAIDILGKSGNKDAVTKDSIANLGVVYLDLNGKK